MNEDVAALVFVTLLFLYNKITELVLVSLVAVYETIPESGFGIYYSQWCTSYKNIAVLVLAILLLLHKKIATLVSIIVLLVTAHETVRVIGFGIAVTILLIVLKKEIRVAGFSIAGTVVSARNNNCVSFSSVVAVNGV